MAVIVVDVESDGPIPGDYSMISFGAVRVDDELDQTFFADLRPISDQWKPDDLAISGYSREQTLTFEDPKTVMERFVDWIGEVSGPRAMFYSDNNGYDWSFINWYFYHFIGKNPFGFGSSNINSLYKGMVKDTFQSFRPLCKTKPDHNPLTDAMGNAEALLQMKTDLGLKISFKR